MKKLNRNQFIEYSNEPDLLDEEQKLKKEDCQVPLDSNHTHFILVDNQKLNEFGGKIILHDEVEQILNFLTLGEVKIRAKLQKEISEEPTRQEDYKEKKDKIPCVFIVIGGGTITVKKFFN